EHGYQVVILEDPTLDLLSQFLSLRRIDRSLVLVEHTVDVRHADAVPGVEAAALEEGLIPERPTPGDPGGLKDDLDPGPVFEPALEPLQEDAPLHGLQPRSDADLAKLRDDPLATRVERGHGRDPVHIETVRKSSFAHQLLRTLDIALVLGPFDCVLHTVFH